MFRLLVVISAIALRTLIAWTDCWMAFIGAGSVKR